MDIITHLMAGAVFAAPVMSRSPITGSCLLLGSVLPDLDSLTRCFGKHAFLRWHQTYTHGLVAVVVSGFVVWTLVPDWADEPWAPVALMVGLILHIALDLSNTYGIAVFAPFSLKRCCTEWVFFIDSVVLVASAAAVGAQGALWCRSGSGESSIAFVYGFFLVLYWAAKMWLRRLAVRQAPEGTNSLIPSALIPWQFFGAARVGDHVRTYRLSALTGRSDQHAEHRVWDALYPTLVETSEFQSMRALSPLYHVTELERRPTGSYVKCRDLRVRNFGGRFGELTALVGPDGQILERAFHV